MPPPRPIMLGIDVDTAGAGDKSNQNLEVTCFNCRRSITMECLMFDLFVIKSKFQLKY